MPRSLCLRQYGSTALLWLELQVCEAFERMEVDQSLLAFSNAVNFRLTAQREHLCPLDPDESSRLRNRDEA